MVEFWKLDSPQLWLLVLSLALVLPLVLVADRYWGKRSDRERSSRLAYLGLGAVAIMWLPYVIYLCSKRGDVAPLVALLIATLGMLVFAYISTSIGSRMLGRAAPTRHPWRALLFLLVGALILWARWFTDGF